ncbi:hypothetical protein F4781DRAFT_443478 [Annulohypoxylon bovei var. microspora]|nr:hypothetical protein F4781DRAFT_443478 [Annulohypoxylon bovei var. microspora]
MGRTEPSVGKPPASFRRDARAKRAKATANKVIPAVLAAHARARRGVDASELIVDPPPPQKRAPTASGEDESRNSAGPRISLRVADTLTAAHSLLFLASSSAGVREPRRDVANTAARVGVLNMASGLAAGGGFLSGAAGRGEGEAALCARSTLLPALRDAFYRLPELGGVFTPDVLVFRGGGAKPLARSVEGKGKGRRRAGDAREGEKGEGVGGNNDDDDDELLPKRERWFVDVVSAAMLRLPEIEVDAGTGWASYARAQDRELAVRKMRAVMRVFVSKDLRRVVLGAWGCGAYGNPVGEIARAWRKVLVGGAGEGSKRGKGKKGAKKKPVESWEGIEHVVFAIKDAGMARAFATAFGEELLDKYDEDGEDGGLSDEETDMEDETVKELRGKIQELEMQAEQARTPQLKIGLNNVLAGLRSQLPDSEDVHSPQDSTNRERNRSSKDDESASEDDDGESAGDESD